MLRSKLMDEFIEIIMKIANNLPSFEGERALFVVLGKQVAKIYLARDGELEPVEGVSVETPKFSDRESFFRRSGRGGVQASGSVYEDQEEHVINSFTIKLAEHLRALISKSSPDCLYLFMPAQLKTIVRSRLSKADQALVKEEFFGNYVDFHPFTLLTMLRDRQDAIREEKKVEPMSREALKIMEKKEIQDGSERSA